MPNESRQFIKSGTLHPYVFGIPQMPDTDVRACRKVLTAKQLGWNDLGLMAIRISRSGQQDNVLQGSGWIVLTEENITIMISDLKRQSVFDMTLYASAGFSRAGQIKRCVAPGGNILDLEHQKKYWRRKGFKSGKY
jgi:hypothetical protein